MINLPLRSHFIKRLKIQKYIYPPNSTQTKIQNKKDNFNNLRYHFKISTFEIKFLNKIK